jgi:hypothetical protein
MAPTDRIRVELLKQYLETNYREYMKPKGYDYWCMLSDIYNILHDGDCYKVECVAQRNYYQSIEESESEVETETELGETEDEAKLCATFC